MSPKKEFKSIGFGPGEGKFISENELVKVGVVVIESVIAGPLVGSEAVIQKGAEGGFTEVGSRGGKEDVFRFNASVVRELVDCGKYGESGVGVFMESRLVLD